jgi:hypothetical protein
MSLFELATRHKYRFPSNKGPLLAEQLFDLPLESKTRFDLDSVAKAIHEELQALGTTSFVNAGPSPLKNELQNKLDLVVYIIKSKQDENAAARAASARRAEREQLVEILNDKKKSELLGLSPEELQKRIDALS